MNKKRLGLSYIEVVFSMLLFAFTVLSISKINILLTNISLAHSKIENYITVNDLRYSLFTEIKTANEILATAEKLIFIYDNEQIVYQLIDGFVYRDGEELIAYKKANFDKINNTIFINITSKDYKIDLNVEGQNNEET